MEEAQTPAVSSQIHGEVFALGNYALIKRKGDDAIFFADPTKFSVADGAGLLVVSPLSTVRRATEQEIRQEMERVKQERAMQEAASGEAEPNAAVVEGTTNKHHK